MLQNVDFPPPPAPGAVPRTPPTPPPLFQTCSLGRGPNEVIVVPPTPVTNGWLDGSSTAS